MPRDYAQRGGNNRQQARGRSGGKRKGGSGLPGWVWLFAGLSVGLAVAAFVYISRPMNGNAVPVFEGTDAGEAVATEQAPAATSKPRQGGKSTTTDKKGAPITLPPKEKARFTFYEILRDQEVVIPQEAVRGDTPPPAVVAAGDGSFVIQVASFRAQTEADRQKASLALIGIESRIESITIDGKDTYYRVRIGPESNWKKVQSTMARLEENDISAMLIKLK